MRKLTAIAGVFLGILVSVFPCGGDAVTSPPSQVSKPSARNGIEITEADLFGSKSWKSTQVRVLGFYLGMTRNQAINNAGRYSLTLLVPDLRNLDACDGNKCEVCDARGICPGIALGFGDDGRIASIQVTRMPEDASVAVRKVAITRKFRGRTYQFFNHYSEVLRMNLLGRGVLVKKEVQSPPKVPLMEVVYNYPERGVEVYASIDETSPQAPVDVDLTVSFVLPRVTAR